MFKTFIACLALMVPATLAAQPNPSPDDAWTITRDVELVSRWPGDHRMREDRVAADLYRPRIDGRVPAAVIINSSGGVLAHTEFFYARLLASQGVAALVVDSFTPRGVRRTGDDQNRVSQIQSNADAIAGFRWFAAQDWVDPSRIIVMGLSRGGEAAYSAAIETLRRRMGAGDIRFAAHVAVAPGSCNFQQRDPRTNGAPIFFMLAELDDAHRVATCMEYIQRMRAAGNNNIRLAVYPGVHHGYEGIGGLQSAAEDWASRRCAGRFFRDENMILYDRATGKRATTGDQTGYLFKTCLEKGITVGGDPRVKAQAVADLLQFLRDVGIIEDREARAVVPDCSSVPEGIHRLNCVRARAGWTGDLVALARYYRRGAREPQNDDALAGRLFQLAAQRGHPQAQWELALMHRLGVGVARDHAVALTLARRAAEAGEPPALNIMGVMARDGIGQPRSDVEAVRLFRQAADLLDDFALANLGRMYWEGRGDLVTDRAQAVRLWRKAAFYANPRARFWLAEALERGEGAGRDVAEATALYHAVAEQDRDPDLKRRANDAIRRLGAAGPGEGAPPDEIFTHEDILNGKSITRAECGAHEHAVWVEHSQGSECIRYFPSNNIHQAPLAVFYFHGDRAGGGKVLGGYRNNTRNTQLALAARNAQENRVPWIIVGRPGAYGSSGDHNKKRQPKEYYSLNAAVDAIKAKHKIGAVVLAGQSGGATVTGALLTLGRTDIACAVGTSGGYAAIARADRFRPADSPKRGLDTTGLANPYEPINEVAGIKADPRRRIFIIGDPKDSNTFFDLQQDFGRKAADAGHHAMVVAAAAKGAAHHDLTLMSYKAAGWCAAALSDREIIERVERNAPPIGEESKRATAEPAAPAQAEVGARINFDSTARGKKERIWGFLSFPSQPQAMYPLMLIMHSSGGVHKRDWFFARTLNDMGVATFVLDSFGPRGMTKVFENKLSFTGYRQLADAVAALDTITRDKRIDQSRIGAMGRSLGGETSIYLSLQAPRSRRERDVPVLSLALAITPGCNSQERDRRMTPNTEAHFFLAEKDFAPHERCIDYARKMNQSGGGKAAFKVYRGAYHTFDGSAKPVWKPNEELYADCANELIEPGHSIRLDTGKPLRTRRDWDEFMAGCVKRGAWSGGDPEATRQLDLDWTSVVKRRWFNH